MATLKEVELKIKGIKKTKQITKAMNMVAASRLRGAQSQMEAFRPYAAKFSEVLGSLADTSGDAAGPLLVPRETPKNVHIVMCTSDRGLCGGFNANLIAKVTKLAEEKRAQGMDVSMTCFGKNGGRWAKKNNQTVVDTIIGVVGSSFGFNVATTAGRTLVNAFLDGDYDEVHLVFSEFMGMAKQVPAVKQLLPIPPIEKVEEVADADAPYLPEHICEPSSEALLNELLPKSVDVQIYSGLLETSTSEHAARMMAMDNATSACNDMLDSLTMAYNKARQAAITSDLMDIVSGAEALKG
jgi:F-type H+-transporting ATPase subunit gamma